MSIRIDITPEEKQKCWEFATDSYLTNVDMYRKRGQYDPIKIKDDIFVGKIAEIAVYKHGRVNNLKITKPDYNVYKWYEKNFSADLNTPNFHFHVKSQLKRQSNNYSESWIFQNTDKLTYSPEEKDILVLTIVDKNCVYIRKILRACDVIGKYKETKNCLPSKVALYYDDIKDLKSNLK